MDIDKIHKIIEEESHEKITRQKKDPNYYIVELGDY